MRAATQMPLSRHAIVLPPLCRRPAGVVLQKVEPGVPIRSAGYLLPDAIAILKMHEDGTVHLKNGALRLLYSLHAGAGGGVLGKQRVVAAAAVPLNAARPPSAPLPLPSLCCLQPQSPAGSAARRTAPSACCWTWRRGWRARWAGGLGGRGWWPQGAAGGGVRLQAGQCKAAVHGVAVSLPLRPACPAVRHPGPGDEAAALVRRPAGRVHASGGAPSCVHAPAGAAMPALCPCPGLLQGRQHEGVPGRGRPGV